MPEITVDPNILIVIATIVCVFASSSTIAGWVNREMPWMAMLSLSIGIGLFAWLHLDVTDGLEPLDVPNAFINVAAMVL